ncbi:unnamed protein product [Amoebophrya sp. A25]|nr:unnamed protein product [Amoebophrya sp. A25]|eukprot:GSA25T00019648001.1
MPLTVSTRVAGSAKSVSYDSTAFRIVMKNLHPVFCI